MQSLSRFVNVQRTGFYKLLKKYRKWTGSATLPNRFTIILESPTSFLQHDFDQNVIEVSELLNATRTTIDSLSDAIEKAPLWMTSDYDSTPAPTRPSTSHGLNGIAGGRSPETNLDLDTILGSSLIAGKGGRAMFWVHSD